MLVPPESSSAVVVMISSKSVSIGNHSRARLVDSSRNRTFYAPQQYRQLLLRARISNGHSVRPSVCHDPVRIQGHVR